MTESPIFITGVYRSGTTLPAQMLNAHSQLCITYDSAQYFRFCLEGFDPIHRRFGEVVDAVADRLYTRFSVEVPRDRILARLEDLDQVSHREVYQAIMRDTFCSQAPQLRWGEKSLLEWTKIPVFIDMFPQGKAVHILATPETSWRPTGSLRWSCHTGTWTACSPACTR